MSRLLPTRITSTGIVYLVLVLVLVAGAVITGVEGRHFFSAGNISAILTGTSILGFIAIGQLSGGSEDKNDQCAGATMESLMADKPV